AHWAPLALGACSPPCAPPAPATCRRASKATGSSWVASSRWPKAARSATPRCTPAQVTGPTSTQRLPRSVTTSVVLADLGQGAASPQRLTRSATVAPAVLLVRRHLGERLPHLRHQEHRVVAEAGTAAP